MRFRHFLSVQIHLGLLLNIKKHVVNTELICTSHRQLKWLTSTVGCQMFSLSHKTLRWDEFSRKTACSSVLAM